MVKFLLKTDIGKLRKKKLKIKPEKIYDQVGKHLKTELQIQTVEERR